MEPPGLPGPSAPLRAASSPLFGAPPPLARRGESSTPWPAWRATIRARFAGLASSALSTSSSGAQRSGLSFVRRGSRQLPTHSLASVRP
eukprot:14667956-Alexandrium_andersonii.AAC.1